jgi:hypothetical protein
MGHNDNKTAKRPNTTKTIEKKRPFSCVRPQTSRTFNLIPNDNKYSKETKSHLTERQSEKKSKSPTTFPSNFSEFGMKSNKNIRLARPLSNYKDKVFNKYWEKENERTIKTVNSNLNSYSPQILQDIYGRDLIKNEMIINPILTNYQTIKENFYNRNLYKIKKLDWHSKKSFHFITNVGGSELQSNIQSIDNSTIFSSRPITSKFEENQNNSSRTNFNIFNKRPVTSKDTLTAKKSRLLSALGSENKKQSLKLEPSISNSSLNPPAKIRPMTAINKPKIRPISGNFPKIE